MNEYLHLVINELLYEFCYNT